MTDQTVTAVLSDKLKAKLGDTYGQLTIDLVAILLPPLKRIGLADANAILSGISNKDSDAALTAAFAAMTNEELVAAKKALAELLKARAGDNAALSAAINAAILKALEVALGLALVGF